MLRLPLALAMIPNWLFDISMLTGLLQRWWLSRLYTSHRKSRFAFSCTWMRRATETFSPYSGKNRLAALKTGAFPKGSAAGLVLPAKADESRNFLTEGSHVPLEGASQLLVSMVRRG